MPAGAAGDEGPAPVPVHVQRYANFMEPARSRELTPEALAFSKPATAAMLRGLFNQGAEIMGEDQAIRLDLRSASQALLRQAQQLLLGFGIKARRSEPRGGMHTLTVSRSSLQRFMREIGFTEGLWVHTGDARLGTVIDGPSLRQDALTDAVESVRAIGDRQVYDLTEPVTDHFVAGRHRRAQLQRVHVPRRHRLQPCLAQPHGVL